MNDDISSEFEFNEEEIVKKRRRLDLAIKECSHFQGTSSKAVNKVEWAKEEQKNKFLGVDAYSRHKMLINEYLLSYPGATKRLKRDTSRDKTDEDVIKANHRFLWEVDDEETLEWGSRLAKRYYDKLFKEYCIADLSRYKENKIAMRWRIEKEVINGKGQFNCGNKHCNEKHNLTSWEVNFGYDEHGEKKNALVKLRLCPSCSDKLNYRQRRRQAKPKSRPIIEEPLPEADISTSNEEAKEYGSHQTTTSFPQPLQHLAGSEDIWTKPMEVEEEKNRDDEFQEFLEDMFL